jgi:hypothetical protein
MAKESAAFVAQAKEVVYISMDFRGKGARN